MEKLSPSSSSIVCFSVLVFIAIICCAQYVDAITCYVCNSHEYPDCFSTPNKNISFEVECDPEDNVCRKQHQWVEGDQSGMGPDERIIRSCGRNETSDNYDKMCIHVTGLDNREDQCFCIRNLCNSAPATLNHNRELQTATALALLFISAALIR